MINKIYNWLKIQPIPTVTKKNLGSCHFEYVKKFGDDRLFVITLFFPQVLGPKTKLYIEGILDSINNLYHTYPVNSFEDHLGLNKFNNYVIRLYTDQSIFRHVENPLINHFLYEILNGPHANQIQLCLYDCGHKYYNETAGHFGTFGTILRFFPMFDESVDEYHMRDTDSTFGNLFDKFYIQTIPKNLGIYLSQSDQYYPTHCHKEFHSSGKDVQLFVSGYMGGFKNKLLIQNANQIIESMFNRCQNLDESNLNTCRYGIDEVVLFDIIHPFCQLNQIPVYVDKFYLNFQKEPSNLIKIIFPLHYHGSSTPTKEISEIENSYTTAMTLLIQYSTYDHTIMDPILHEINQIFDTKYTMGGFQKYATVTQQLVENPLELFTKFYYLRCPYPKYLYEQSFTVIHQLNNSSDVILIPIPETHQYMKANIEQFYVDYPIVTYILNDHRIVKFSNQNNLQPFFIEGPKYSSPGTNVSFVDMSATGGATTPPSTSVSKCCYATLRNGQKCQYRAKFGDFCGIHKNYT